MSYPNLKVEMIRHGVSNGDVATTVNRSKQTVSNWLNTSSECKASEAVAIRDKYFPEMKVEYLFSYQQADVSLCEAVN